jgi:hypothetical protein
MLTYDHENKVVCEVAADINNDNLDLAAEELRKAKALKEKIRVKEITIEKEKAKTSLLNVDQVNYIIEKHKMKCKYQRKVWKKTSYGEHYNFPKHGFLFASYFNWIKANTCKSFCPKHNNCNLSILHKISPLNSILAGNGLKYSKKKNTLSKKTENTIVGEIWLGNKFPLSLGVILPLLDVLSNENPLLSKFIEFLKSSSIVKQPLLPIKTVFPVAFSIRAQIQFLHISLKYSYIATIGYQRRNCLRWIIEDMCFS